MSYKIIHKFVDERTGKRVDPALPGFRPVLLDPGIRGEQLDKLIAARCVKAVGDAPVMLAKGKGKAKRAKISAALPEDIPVEPAEEA